MGESSGATTLVVPAGTRLLHIGPHKTGTSGLQGAFHVARPALAAQGVHYAGRTRQPLRAAHAVTGRRFQGGAVPPIWLWHDVVREIRRAREPRVVLSSEGFAVARPDAIRRIVADLDPSRVHVAVTLRPLTRIITSQWQQNVQSGSPLSFDAWLEATLGAPGGREKFWRRHRHDELIARWAEVVGPDRMTVVVVHDRDRGVVLRAFERLLGLRDGTLVEDDDLANRSMTLPEVEAVRAFNVAFRARGLDRALHARVLRTGAARLMKRRDPSPDWPRIEPPQWALDRAGEVAREMVRNIAASGVRVIGDLAVLTEVPVGREESDRQPDVRIPAEIAASLAMGVLVASGAAARRDSTGIGLGAILGPASSEPPELARLPTASLVATVLSRGGRVTVGRARKLLRRRP